MKPFLVDGRTIQDHYWGIGRYVFHLIRALAEIAPQFEFRVLYNPNARNTRFDFAELAACNNIKLVPTEANAFSLAEQQLARHTALNGTSLYHAPYYALPYAVNKPLVVTLEDVTPLVIPQEMPHAGKRMVYRLLNQLAASRAKRIITISNASKRDLVNTLHTATNKITVVPLATFENISPASQEETQRVRAALNLPARYLLYLGINKPHKNLLRLVQAFAQIHSDTALVLAGHWDARFPETKNFVAQNQLETRVQFRHDVAESDLPGLLSGATAFVFPSLHEGFGLPPLEAMSCGTPVVCSNASALPEVVGQAALGFDPLDVQDIANALSKISEDAQLRDRLRQAGLEQAKQFSWNRTAGETLKVYQEIAADG